MFTGTLEALMQEPRSLTASICAMSSRSRAGDAAQADESEAQGARCERAQSQGHRRRDSARCADGRHRRQRIGKSTLVHDVIYAALKRAKSGIAAIGTHRKLEGAEFVTDVVLVDQAPIGRTPRSNPVTYLKAFDPIRELFAATKDAGRAG